jgi:uncharacterized RDD family membrane protein YckC
MNDDIIQLSPIKLRLYSLLIDLLVLAPYTFLAGKLFSKCANLAGDDFSQLLVYVCLIPFYFAGIFFIIIFPEGVWGQTLGKWAMGIKVVDRNDHRPGIIGSLIRHFLDPIDIYYLVGYFIAHKNINKQKIGDIVEHAMVIRYNKQPPGCQLIYGLKPGHFALPNQMRFGE